MSVYPTTHTQKYYKTYEFRMYRQAGHAFLADYRPSYRAAAAQDMWHRVLVFYDKYLKAEPAGGRPMPIVVIGGTVFIGTRVIRRLAARGEEVAVMDINPGTASFDDLDKQVQV